MNSQDRPIHVYLSHFPLQLESLKSHRAIQQPEISKELSDLGKSMSSQIENADQSDGSVVDTEEIVKELKKVKRQNSITHWLLSVMLVLTVTWQISEVSLFFKLKNGLNHPFRYLGGMFTGMLKGSDMKDQDEQKQNQLDYTLACVSI